MLKCELSLFVGYSLMITAAAQAQTSPALGGRPAQAEQPVDGRPPSSDPKAPVQDGGVVDIVVTAQKRSESLQRVPAAVSVLDDERLTDLGVTSLTQIGNLAPGISVVPTRTQAFIFIRGVGQTLTSPNADAAVAVNLNGVYQPAEMAGTAFFDVERVELLPGPQGTLYGRNSTGGVVNIASRMPGPDFAAGGFVEIGNYQRRQIVLGVDLPLTATLRSRTAGTIVRHDGYFNNGEDDQRTAAIRQTLVWQPASGTTMTGVATYTHDGGIGNVFQNLPAVECGNRCSTFDPRALGYFNRADTFQGSIQLDQEITDRITLTYIGGYNRLKLKVKNSIWTGPPLAPLIFDERINIQSHELRLNTDLGRLKGIVGAYYFDQDTFYQNDVRANATQHRINPFDAGSRGTAIFGQATYAVTSGLRATGGLRLSRTVKSIAGVNNLYSAADILVTSRPYSGRSELSQTDWKIGFELDVAAGSMLYGNISTGFTPGGFSTAPLILGNSAAAPFEPVSLQAYVAGLKSRLFDGRLTLNAEGFYYDYRNYQVSARNIATGENTVYNAEKATVYGAQLDMRFAPTSNDDLSFAATILDAKADRLVTPAGRFDGFDLPYSPKWTLNASYQRSFDLAAGDQIRAGVNFKYTSDRWAIYTHLPGFHINANTHTDLTLGYFAAQDSWYLQGFVRNLEDSLVKTACGTAVPGPVGCFFEAPRTYGATIGFRLRP